MRAVLVAWYRGVFRPLPWRAPPPAAGAAGPDFRPDPWAVWVSEVMLQQTRVDSVKPYFARFMARFPTPAALAEAPADTLSALWAGLGYYARARNLQTAARQVVERHNGKVPNDPEAFGALTGVGPYTRGAVQSIAFGRPLAALDGNVERVLCRLLRLEGDPRSTANRTHLWAVAEAFAQTPADSDQEPGTVNQAFMELGATVCTPRSPRCLLCPLSGICAARAAGVEATLPQKAPRPARPVHPVAAALITNLAGAVFLVRNPAEGLLGGLNTLPLIEQPASEDPADAQVLSALGLHPVPGAPLTTIEHAFTHKVWRVGVFACADAGDLVGTFVKPADLADAALSGPALKVLRSLKYPVSHRRGAGRA
jgi:A/G-specific adenine glycosylase